MHCIRGKVEFSLESFNKAEICSTLKTFTLEIGISECQIMEACVASPRSSGQKLTPEWDFIHTHHIVL